MTKDVNPREHAKTLAEAALGAIAFPLETVNDVASQTPLSQKSCAKST